MTPSAARAGTIGSRPTPKPSDALAVAEHVTAIERLHDVAPLPGLAVVDVAFVEQVEPAEVRSVTGVGAGRDL